MTIGTRLGAALPGCAALALLLGVIPAQAEVGVPYDLTSPSTKSPSSYVFYIIDDIDPITWFWVRSSPQGSPRVVLNPEGETNGDGPPSILYNTVSGLPIVAWARNSLSGYDIVISHFADGAWSEPQVVAGSPDDELDPYLILDPSDGSVHLVYWVDSDSKRVMHRQAPADLSSWTDAIQVSQEGEMACRPGGVFHQGVLRVSYEAHEFGFEGTPRQVVMARREGDGFLPEVMAITHNTDPVWPQVHSMNDHLWLDWIDTPGNSGEMAWTRMDSRGAWEPIRYEPYATREERDFLVRGGIRLKAIQDP